MVGAGGGGLAECRGSLQNAQEVIEHVENLQRVMSKLEKDKQGMKAEINATVETTQKIGRAHV